MATIYKEILIAAPAHRIWDAVRDFGAVHRRLAIGFVTDVKLEEDARIVTFANGLVARERLIGIDDEIRRLAYAVTGGRLTHHNASMQIFAEGENKGRAVWITDLLPDHLADTIRGMVEQGAAAMRRTLEHDSPG